MIKTAVIFLVLLGAFISNAQTPYVRSADLTTYEVNGGLLHQKVKSPTGIKPLLADKFDLDTIWGYHADSAKYYYKFTEKLFKENLLQIEEQDVFLTLNPAIAVGAGRDIHNGKQVWSNVRGFQATGDIAGKLQFGTTFHETALLQPLYEQHFTDSVIVVPGWGRTKRANKVADIGVSAGWVSVPFSKWWRATLGHGKHSFGHGHRGLLLSYNAANYGYLSNDFWAWNSKIHYRHVYAELQILDRKPEGEVPEALFKEKAAVIHMLSIRPFDALEIGFMQMSHWRRFDQLEGNVDLPLESLVPLPGYTLSQNGFDDGRVRSSMAASVMFKLRKVGRAYSQVMWTREGSPTGYQFGAEVNDFLTPHLHLGVEFNRVLPFAYASETPFLDLSNQSQVMGTPIGSNSQEWIAKGYYRKGRVFSKAQYNWINRATGRSNDASFVLQSVDRLPFEERTTINRAQLDVGYIFNPTYNLHVSLGALYRNDQLAANIDNSTVLMFTLGTDLVYRNTDF